MNPLNGSNTLPIKAESIRVMRLLANEPIPRSKINPGVVNRLWRGDNGIPFITICDGLVVLTPAGDAFLQQLSAEEAHANQENGRR